jgi:hypothetical protein
LIFSILPFQQSIHRSPIAIKPPLVSLIALANLRRFTSYPLGAFGIQFHSRDGGCSFNLPPSFEAAESLSITKGWTSADALFHQIIVSDYFPLFSGNFFKWRPLESHSSSRGLKESGRCAERIARWRVRSQSTTTRFCWMLNQNLESWDIPCASNLIANRFIATERRPQSESLRARFVISTISFTEIQSTTARDLKCPSEQVESAITMHSRCRYDSYAPRNSFSSGEYLASYRKKYSVSQFTPNFFKKNCPSQMWISVSCHWSRSHLRSVRCEYGRGWFQAGYGAEWLCFGS